MLTARHRSKDGRRETREIVENPGPAPTRQGRDGDLARKTGTKAELRRTVNSSAGVTGVTKSDEDRPGTDNLGERNK